MAFVSKAKLVGNLFNWHIAAGNALFYKLGTQVVDVVAVGHAKVALKVGAKVALGNIKMGGNGLYLNGFGRVYVLVYVGNDLFIVKVAALCRQFHTLYRLLYESEYREDLVKHYRRHRNVLSAVVGRDVAHRIL